MRFQAAATSSMCSVKQLFTIDIAGATDTTGMSGTEAATHAVAKTLSIDVADLLKGDGIDAKDIPSKIEGVAFGDDVTVGGQVLHTVFVANDNDFTPDSSGPSQYFVFGATDADLHGLYAAQQLSAVPLPKSMPLFAAALGLLGILGWRRKASRA